MFIVFFLLLENHHIQLLKKPHTNVCICAHYTVHYHYHIHNAQTMVHKIVLRAAVTSVEYLYLHMLKPAHTLTHSQTTHIHTKLCLYPDIR